MGRRLGRKRRKVTLADMPVIGDNDRPHAARRITGKSAPHDRRARDLVHAEVMPLDVEDPYEPGAKITVLRSTRRDPLAWMHAHEQITDAQYLAGRDWQRDWERCEQGARAIDPTREAVDGGRLPEPLSDKRTAASERLAGVAVLIARPDERRILHAFLVDGMGVEQIALVYFRRIGAGHLRRFGDRVREILDTLAVFYGYAMAVRVG